MQTLNSLMPLIRYLVIIVIVSFLLSLVLTGCASQREGCWKGAEPRFRYNTTKMRA
jgi:hypothetical protein